MTIITKFIWLKKIHCYMEYDFGIRLEMGSQVGSGHFYRCLALSKELRKHGKKVIFLVSNKKKLAKHITGNVPFYVVRGKSEKDFVNHCFKLSKNIKVFIFDLPFHNELYSKKFENHDKTVVIDDLGNKTICSKVLFNGSIIEKFYKYKLKDGKTRKFFGPKYMVLREGFLKKRSYTKIKSNSIKKILLTFGGNDEQNMTKKILYALLKKKFGVSVVLGPTYLQKKRLIDSAKQYSNLHIESNVKNMAKLIYKQDLVISRPGITTYELACLGVPTLLIPSSRPQNLLAQKMQKNGFGLNYGYWDNDFSRLDNFLSQLDDYKVRKNMHNFGKKMVDGKGLFRVSKILLSLLKK